MSDKIEEFEGLRAVLALWVFVFHIFSISGLNCNSLLDGRHAVSVFFALSGFVIAKLLDTKHESYTCFILRRLFRLFPAYCVCILFSVILISFGIMPKNFDSETISIHAILHALMLHGVVPKSLLAGAEGVFLNPAWSVSVEWQFYLLIPLFFMLRRWKSVVAFLCLLLIASVARRLLVPLFNLGGGSLFEHVHLFILGIFSYFFFIWINLNYKNLELVCKIAPIAFPLALMPLVPIESNLGVLIWLFVFGSLVSSRHRCHWFFISWITRLLRNPILVYLGAISYALYLIHEPIIWISQHGLKYFIPKHSSQQAVFIISFVAVPVSVFLAHWIHKWVELPCIKLGKRLTSHDDRVKNLDKQIYSSRQ